MSGGRGGAGGGVGWTGNHGNMVAASVSRFRAQKSVLDSAEAMLKESGIKSPKRPSWMKRVWQALFPRKAVLTFSGESGMTLPIGSIVSDGNQELEVVGIADANTVRCAL